MSLSLARRRAEPTGTDVDTRLSGVVAVLDAALARSSDRRRYERSEAIRVLADVRAAADAAHAPDVAGAINDAVMALGTGDIVERRQVVDALLDLRLTLTTS